MHQLPATLLPDQTESGIKWRGLEALICNQYQVDKHHISQQSNIYILEVYINTVCIYIHSKSQVRNDEGDIFRECKRKDCEKNLLGFLTLLQYSTVQYRKIKTEVPELKDTLTVQYTTVQYT